MRRPTIVFGDLLTDLDSTQGRLVSYTMYLLNLGFISLYILGTFQYFEDYSLYIRSLEALLALVFTFEYISRLDYAEDTWSEITDIYSIADIVAVLPALLVVFVPVLGGLTSVRSLQFLRIFRFIRLGLENNRFFDYELSNKQVTTAEVITTIGVILFVHAGLVFAFESGTNPDFQNFGDAFYYSIVALTTTGFGNTTPQTTMGQIVTSVGLIFAITIIPWLAFRGKEADNNNSRECHRCGDSNHSDDARYCHQCGYDISQDS